MYKALPQIDLTQTAVAVSTTMTGYHIVNLQADPDNAGTMKVGDKDVQEFCVTAGNREYFGPCALSELFVKSTAASGDKATPIVTDQ